MTDLNTEIDLTNARERAPHTGEVIAAVLAERIRQDGIWGVQNHPAGTGMPFMLAGAWDIRWMADHFRQRCKRKTADGTVTWVDILLEEVFELLAETDPIKIHEEAVQVSAVAAAMAQSVDRNSPLLCQLCHVGWPCRHTDAGHVPVRPSQVLPHPDGH